MGRLRDLRGVLIRNLVVKDDSLPSTQRDGLCGSCFSVHLVEARSGELCEDAVYTSTLCAQVTNASWTDIEHEDMTVRINGNEAAHQRWAVGQFGIRVWRCGRGISKEPTSEQRQSVVPRVAAWERLQRPDVHGGEENGFLPGRKGSMAGTAEPPRVSSAAATAAAYQSMDFELAFEVRVLLDEWIKVDTPLAQLQLPLPKNSLLLMLADATGRVGTYFDPRDAGMLSVMNRASVMAGRKPHSKDPTNSKGLEGYRSDGYKSDGRSTDGKVEEGYRSEGSVAKQKLEQQLGSEGGRGGSSMTSVSSSPVGSTTSDSLAGADRGVIPRACSLRAEALERMRSAVSAEKKAAAEAASRLEQLLEVQVAKEDAKRRRNECVARLRHLRKKVQEEERVVSEHRSLADAEQAKQDGVGDSATARKNLQARAVVLLCRQGLVDAEADGETSSEAGGSASSNGGLVSLGEALAAAESKLESGSKQLEEVCMDLRVRQSFLIAALHSAYPITTGSDGVTRTICGLTLPSPQAIPNADDETVSTALGHVCHLVSLIAKYSRVYLRFQPVPMASRSVMRDKVLGVTRTNTKDGSDFPLFLKGQDRSRVQNAVYMVSRDVEQLMAAHGLVPAESAVQMTPHGQQSSILSNLQSIVVSSRQKLLAALGGVNAFQALDSASVAALAISKDEVAKLAGSRQISTKRGEGSSGGGAAAVRPRSGGSSSTRPMSGSEYVSGLAKGVDRMLENLLFPSVSTASSDGTSSLADDASSTSSRKSRADSRKNRELARRDRKSVV